MILLCNHFFSDKMFLFARSNKTCQNYTAPCKELCHLNSSSCAHGLKGQSKGHIRLLPPPPLPPPTSLLSFSPGCSLLWALSHHPSCAFHSLTTPGNTRTTIITSRLIPFLSPCPLKSSTFSSHRLIFLQHRLLSDLFPVQECLLIPWWLRL